MGLASQAVELPGCWHEGIRIIFFSFQNVVIIAEWSVYAPHSPLGLLGCSVVAGSLLRTQAMLADGALSVRIRGSSTLPWPHPTVCKLTSRGSSPASQLGVLTMTVS